MKFSFIIYTLLLLADPGCAVDEPELPEARQYKIVGTHEIRLNTENRKARMWFITSDAGTFEAFAQTSMKAAYEMHAEHKEYGLVEVMLVPDASMARTTTYYARTSFAPDQQGALGLSGVDLTTMKPYTWFVRAANQPLTEKEMKVAMLWYQHQDDFPQKNLFSSQSYDEESLKEFIADAMGIHVSDVTLVVPVLSDYAVK